MVERLETYANILAVHAVISFFVIVRERRTSQ
jgi:hypothetical protein